MFLNLKKLYVSFFLSDAFFECLFRVMRMSLGSFAHRITVRVFTGFLEIKGLHKGADQEVSLHEQTPYRSAMQIVNILFF